MKEKIVEYEGKKYALVSDNEGRECERCVLLGKCQGKVRPICQDEMGFTEEETFKHRLEEVLDEQKMNDEYQERIKTAGDRADDIVWCLVILLAAQLIGGKIYSNLFVACAGGLLYMLLSALQAVWRRAAIWWFKNHHVNGVPTDYPEWIGGTAWALYYLKMAVITAAVVYIAYSFLRLL